MESGIKDLIKAIEDSGRNYDIEKITKAYNYAAEAHNGQKRRSGEDYIWHPVCVTKILVGLGMDIDTLIAALLHDVAEDTDRTLEDISKTFSPDIARLVDGVTKLNVIELATREEWQAENIRKMLLAMSKDVRVVIIKLADRLHNMRTIEVLPEVKRYEKALETMEVYAPIAGRLGIRSIKEELEDISIRFLDPIAYKEIEDALDSHKDERELFLNTISDRIKARFSSKEGSRASTGYTAKCISRAKCLRKYMISMRSE